MHALIVDDDVLSLAVAENALAQMGYQSETVPTARAALEAIQQQRIRLVIISWNLPNGPAGGAMSGLDLCRAIRQKDLHGYVYIMMMVDPNEPCHRMEGLHAGVDCFVTKPLAPAEMLMGLKAAERVNALETRDLALLALAKLAESRDTEAGAHIERMQAYTQALAEQLATTNKYGSLIDREYIRLIHQTCPLHDIGKVAIPDRILLKPGKLDEQEFSLMQRHTDLGAHTLDAALGRFSHARYLRMARQIAASHHEKFDGSGYPEGLVGAEIPLCGRIVALADVYDALTSRRVYKDAISHEQAREIILRESGGHFDPDVVAAFLACEERFCAIREMHADLVTEAPAASVEMYRPSCATDAAHPVILLVQPDEDAAERCAERLGQTGYDVLIAHDATQALDLLCGHPIRLIIAELDLPGMDGMELCRRIRSSDASEYLFFMLLAREEHKPRMLEAVDAGADDFLITPCQSLELLARLRAGMRTIRLHDELDRRNRGSVQLNAQLSRLNSSLEKMAITDDLTGLQNRRQTLTRLDEQCALAERYGGPLSVAMLDLDYFKKINDTFGHDAGDEVLRTVAALLRASVRATDTVARIGGEEFLLVFPAQCASEAAISAERCREAIEEHRFRLGENEVMITVSIGVAGRRPNMLYGTELIKQADLALYEAKNLGRNRVTVRDNTLAYPQQTAR